MTWQNEMVRILRHLIDDLDSATYADSRLEELILVSAQLMIDTIDFDNTYTIDVDTLALSPDPTTLTTKDNEFINLVCLKSACIILGSEAKTAASHAYVIKDGPSAIDGKGVYAALKQIHNDMLDTLANAILAMRAGNSVAGEAILTPYTYEGYGADYYRNYA